MQGEMEICGPTRSLDLTKAETIVHFKKASDFMKVAIKD
jgi:hypothetical protein